MEDASALTSLLDEFPPVHAAFAYGSAIFPQRGYTAEQQEESMTDLVFCTNDPLLWHYENLKRHPAHYSSVALGGPRAVMAIQKHGAGVYYNTLVHVRGRLIKYGVVQTSTLADDLRHWHSLYLSGRMQKPVRMLTPSCDELGDAAATNLRGALVTALLLLPKRFGEVELLSTICGLSYGGDVRMGVGESWSKVDHIVAGQLEPLRRLYAHPIAQLQCASGVDTGCISDVALLAACGSAPSVAGVSYEQDIGLDARLRLIGLVPSTARRGLLDKLRGTYCTAGLRTEVAQLSANGRFDHLEHAVKSTWRRASGTADANRIIGEALRSSVFNIVRRASYVQTLKGVATAGALRAARYAFTKVSKRVLAG